MWDSINEVYQLKEARTKNIRTVQPFLKAEILETKLSEEDDNDSGFSNENGSISHPVPSMNELATCLASASLKNPAYIKAKVLRNFQASRPGTELSVTQGEIVSLLYREQDQVLVINSQGKKGFIPYHCCSLLRKKIPCEVQIFTQKPKNQFSGVTPVQTNFLTESNKSSLQHSRHRTNMDSNTRSGGYVGRNSKNSIKDLERPNISSSSEEESDYNRRSSSQYYNEKSSYCRENSEYLDKFTWNRNTHEDIHRRQKLTTSYFRKRDQTKMLVLYDFIARDENDISIYRGEVVAVLNRDDMDWWWVLAEDGYEGFVPRAYLGSLSSTSSQGSTPCSSESFSSSSTTSEASSTQAVRFQDPLCTFHRYEKEEWETDSELCRDSGGYPAVEAGRGSTGYGDARSQWSTWC